MKNSLAKFVTSAICIVLVILFLLKFGVPMFLRAYVETGAGDCKKIPLFCMSPDANIILARADKGFVSGLQTYKFPTMQISVPKGFSVVQEEVRKFYPRKNKGQGGDDIVYVLHQEKDFFITLFPQLSKQGIKDDYEFIKRTMQAKVGEIKNVTSAFFVIMKGIFTPDLGDQHTVTMTRFAIGDKKGFINYNLEAETNYFDCNVINDSGGFFKVYIRDTERTLNLEKVLDILSTLTEID